ncbi:hypothetical protein [Algoriphagus resistens]|uniref:hypothetical protein n=1 Tax=Algoriphagus resistens TaxID=1750590 RepID=UPI0007167C74|nr:hypothetical protein [Algoriphagus resistens]
MKNKFLHTVIAILVATSCFAQQKITISKPASGSTLTFQASNAKGNIDVSKLNTKENITISPDPALSSKDYVLRIENVMGQDITATQIPDKETGVITGITSGKTLYLVFKSSGFQDLIIADIGKDASTGSQTPNPTNNLGKTVSALDFLLNNFEPTKYSYHDLKSLVMRNTRYFSGSDQAFIILDENGRLIGNVPVNLDQDDRFYIYLVVDRNDIDKYDLEVVGAEYSPVDLQIRSYEPINKETFSTQGSKSPADWTVIRFERGPYTSDNVTFNIKKTDENEQNQMETNVLSTYTLKINKLYHVAIGASFISTNLAKPDFDVFPLTDTTNTINALNNGSRTMLTFNVIWYWQNTFKYLRNGSDLTRGRDILKEPNWLTRLNPTFGVSIDNTFRENFFVGGTYEFARGGSLIFGGHYGKIKEVATKAPDGTDFVLGQSVYTGTADNIKLTDAWKWGFFFGVTLDTRIFNKILTRN